MKPDVIKMSVVEASRYKRPAGQDYKRVWLNSRKDHRRFQTTG
jgi:hypothetical protein